MAPIPAAPPLPTGALEVIGRLDEVSGGEERSFATGEPLHALLCGIAPPAVLVTSEAPPAAALRRLPRAVPVAPALAVVAVPTPTGPVDVAFVDDVEEWLARRCFRVHAVGWDPLRARWIDPHGGLADIEAGTLRCVGSAQAALARDPLASVRAGRLVATFGVRADPDLETALRASVPVLHEADRTRLRSELFRTLLGEHAGEALALWERTGVQARLAPGALPDAPAVVPALPPDRALRLAAWLRGARAQRLLQRWRVPRPLASRVSLLLRHHPVELQAEPRRDASVRRLLARAGSELAGLLALREAELRLLPGRDADAARKRLDALRAAVERVREARRRAAERTRLALDGDAVMAALGCGPGPHVGRALRHLTEWAAAEPGRNRETTLRAELRRWAEAHPGDLREARRTQAEPERAGGGDPGRAPAREEPS